MPRGGDAGGGKKGSSVQFSKPQEPSFLRDLKRQVGYKDPVEDMNAKVLLYSCFDIVMLNRYKEKLLIFLLYSYCLYSEKVYRRVRQ